MPPWVSYGVLLLAWKTCARLVHVTQAVSGRPRPIIRSLQIHDQTAQQGSYDPLGVWEEHAELAKGSIFCYHGTHLAPSLHARACEVQNLIHVLGHQAYL